CNSCRFTILLLLARNIWRINRGGDGIGYNPGTQIERTPAEPRVRRGFGTKGGRGSRRAEAGSKITARQEPRPPGNRETRAGSACKCLRAIILLEVPW